MIKRFDYFLANAICKIVAGKSLSGNGFSNNDFDQSSMHMIRLWNQHRSRSPDRHRNRRGIRFQGQHETPAFEGLDAAIPAGSAFGKDHHRRSTLDRFRSLM